MLNVPAHRLTDSMKSRLALFLVLVFSISVFAPLASAAGMQACNDGQGGICDSWDKADDGTSNQQDWIEGVYEFDLVDTSTINMQMSWALREFNRTTLGLVGFPFDDAWTAEGMSDQDGAPADLIRNYFDKPISGTVTVKDKLEMEVNSSIQELLDSGFGTVNSISTAYVGSISNSGITTTCSDNPDTDSQEENPSLSNNVFDPPICFTTTASVTLSTSTFNLGSVDSSTLDRVYRGMLVMGSDITSEFDLFSDPGHNSVFVINPPDFATVKGVDALGVQIVRSGPPSYMAAQWSINNLEAPLGGDRIAQTVSVEIGHRNSTQTSSVEITPQDTGITLGVTLNLYDENAATVEIVAGINHIDQSTMDDWGVSLVDVTQNAKVPWVTADGIRLAYHNDLIELDDFSENFPMDNVGDSIKDSTPAEGDIIINSPTWVSKSTVIGIPEPGGGLNYTHTNCPESLPPGTVVNYCIEGQDAMGGDQPIYLQSTSNAFELHLLDLLMQELEKKYADDAEIIDVLGVIEESDIQKLLDAGFAIDTQFGEDLLKDMIPKNLPPTELTLEIILPSWTQAATGDSSIVLSYFAEGSANNDLSFSMAGPNAYDPRHAILDSNDQEICSADRADWSCIDLDVEMDVSDLDFNEWGPSIELTASFSASIDVYRIKLPDLVVEKMTEGETKISGEVIPSDLIRHGFDITDRLLEPISRDVTVTDGEKKSFEMTTAGFEKFVNNLGKDLTKMIHESSAELGSEDEFTDFDLTGFQVITSLENLGGIGSTFGDETPISLKVRIPEFTLKAGVTNGWSGIMDGDPTIGVTTVFNSPMISVANSFSNALTSIGSQFVQMAGTGITLDNNGQPFNFIAESQDMVVHEDTGSELRGKVTFLMPDGITLENFQTANGWEEVGEEDGRQKITISLESFSKGDEFTFSLKVSWLYILSQIWIYPTIMLSLIVWRVRARRKKKRKKAETLITPKVVSSGKGGLSNSDFASLGSGYDPSKPSSGDFDLYGDDEWS